jgi:cytochrome c-type biogenesis protein CcmH
MTLLPGIGFAVVALAAIGFATFALWRRREKGGWLLGLAIALFVAGVGGGTYGIVGRPGLANRAAQGLSTHDINGLIPFLITRVHKQPTDIQAWVYLGRAYMTVGDAADSAKAFSRAVTVARLNHAEDPTLDSAYGQAEVAANGVVTDEAVSAFAAALKLNPRDPAARYFLGQARAEHGDKAGALALWQNLLADVPPASPLHQVLVDRIALLTAQGGSGAGGPPDPRAMVAGLAARLKSDPNDPAGWQRLIRAYTVLGQPDDAKTALATARKTFAADKPTLSALDAEAKDLKLD